VENTDKSGKIRTNRAGFSFDLKTMIYFKSIPNAQRVYLPASVVAHVGDVFTLAMSNTMREESFTLSLPCVAVTPRWYVFDISGADEFTKGFYRYRLLNESDDEVTNGYAFVGVKSTGTKKQHHEEITIKQYGE